MIDNIDEYHELYERVVKLYESDGTTSWKKIATIIHDENAIFVQIYRKLRHDEQRREIKISYKDNLTDIQKQLQTETSPINRVSLITAGFHHIIYNLLSTEGNYKLLLNGESEMIVLKKKIRYYFS